MNNFFKAMLPSLVAAVAAVLAVVVAFWLVGNQSANLQGISNNRFPNSGVTARCFNISTSTPQTVCVDGQLSVPTGRTLLADLITGDNDNTLPGIVTSTIGGVTAANICNENVIDINLPTTNQTITLPSSSAVFSDCLTAVSRVKRVYLQNASGSGAFTIGISDQSSTLKTIAAASSTDVNGTSSLNFGNQAILDGIRTASGTSVWLNWLLTVYR